MLFTRPEPKFERLRFELLTFDPRHQMRVFADAEPPSDPRIREACWRKHPDSGELVQIANECVAAEIAEALAEPGFEFLEAFQVIKAPGKSKRSPQPIYYCFGGFTRGAAVTLHGGPASVPCDVWEGTFEDALFWSLSENFANHQSRGHGSARRSVETLIDSAVMFDRVRQEAQRRNETLHVAIAAACRVSRTTVDRVLQERGLGIDGLKLVA